MPVTVTIVRETRLVYVSVTKTDSSRPEHPFTHVTFIRFERMFITFSFVGAVANQGTILDCQEYKRSQD
jgi:hypothetical protein